MSAPYRGRPVHPEHPTRSEQPDQTAQPTRPERSAPPPQTARPDYWTLKYCAALAGAAALWLPSYLLAQTAAARLVYGLLGLEPGSRLGAALEFFVYDSAKILLLLIAVIYGVAWLRAGLNPDAMRNFLAGKRRGLGYLLGALFGAVTPFCSCSSIPLFLGFNTARLPIGIGMSFLITSPIINEIAVVLLWGLLGWKFALAYLAAGLAAGVLGGWFMDSIKAGRWLQPLVREAAQRAPGGTLLQMSARRRKPGPRERHAFAWRETKAIFRPIWKWVILGVGLGAGLHGFVPQDWFARHLGAGEWWSVPAAVLVGIPLYSNVTGIVPVMESLLLKGLPLGTTLAFCMSAVAASLPEVMMLRQIMQARLQALFIAYLWAAFTLTGWAFNWLAPYLLARP